MQFTSPSHQPTRSPNSFQTASSSNHAVPTTIMSTRSSLFTPLATQHPSYAAQPFLKAQASMEQRFRFESPSDFQPSPQTHYGAQSSNPGYYRREAEATSNFFYPDQSHSSAASTFNQGMPSNTLSRQSAPFMSASSVPNFASISGKSQVVSSAATDDQNRVAHKAITAEDRIKLITGHDDTSNFAEAQHANQGLPSSQQQQQRILQGTTAGSEFRHSSVDFSGTSLQQKSSSTKPAIAEVGRHPPTEDTSCHSFINKIEYASVSAAGKKRKKPAPVRKLGYQILDGPNSSMHSGQESDRKTESASSASAGFYSAYARENRSHFSGKRSGPSGQNFSYNNFQSFGGHSHHQSENYPPAKLQHQNSVQQTKNAPLISSFEQQQSGQNNYQRQGEWMPNGWSQKSALRNNNAWPQSQRSLNLTESRGFNCENKIYDSNQESANSQWATRSNLNCNSKGKAVYQFKKKSPTQAPAHTQLERRPLEEQLSFGKVSSSPKTAISSEIKPGTQAGAAAASTTAAAGSSDSDKTSSQSSQPVVRRLKYEMCKNWREKGSCKYGDKCLFAHGSAELTKRSTANGPEPAKPAQPAKPAEPAKPAVAEKEEEPKPVVQSSAEKIGKIGVQPQDMNDEKIAAGQDSSVKIKTLFKTPEKTGSPEQMQTPAFSSCHDMSTMPSTNQCKAQGQEHTFTKLSAAAQSNARAKAAQHEHRDSSSSSQEEKLISGDLNFLLDKEIQKVAFLPKPVLIRGGCNSTNHSSSAKSPLATYAIEQPPSPDFVGAPGSSLKKGSSVSQLSSFDESLNNMFPNERASLGRTEVSPGKIGEGLFPMAVLHINEPVDLDAALSSEEENLIAQSTFEIKNIFQERARLTCMSRLESFAEELLMSDDNEESEDGASVDGQFPARRLRIFQDITHQSAGKNNTTQEVVSQNVLE